MNDWSKRFLEELPTLREFIKSMNLNSYRGLLTQDQANIEDYDLDFSDLDRKVLYYAYKGWMAEYDASNSLHELNLNKLVKEYGIDEVYQINGYELILSNEATNPDLIDDLINLDHDIYYLSHDDDYIFFCEYCNVYTEDSDSNHLNFAKPICKDCEDTYIYEHSYCVHSYNEQGQSLYSDYKFNGLYTKEKVIEYSERNKLDYYFLDDDSNL